AKEGDHGKAVVAKEKRYEREPGCKAIALVPGPQKGMFPSREDCPDGCRKFHNVGVVEVENISIAWPKRSHDRRSPPLAEIIECEDAEYDGLVRRLKITHPSLYTTAYEVLQANT
ncbi:hypothetical protein BGX28_002566, partial [Mortierella sp. GBA30]